MNNLPSDPDFPTKGEVERAGNTLRDTNEVRDLPPMTIETINDWRSSHRFPLYTVQMGIRRHSLRQDPDAVISQRLKRLVSIQAKLIRFENMKYHQVQDLGGCRVVFKQINNIQKTIDSYEGSQKRHKLHGCKNYIESPKPDGYRSVHLVYRYMSDKNAYYNGRLIEIQLRTALQHMWATALETVDVATGSDLKLGGGTLAWKRFFVLASNIFAYKECTPTIPGAPDTIEHTIEELRISEKQLNALTTLEALRSGVETMQPSDSGGLSDDYRKVAKGGYQLITLEIISPTVTNFSFTAYRLSDYETAQKRYAELEVKNDRNVQTVLVSTRSIMELSKAYPNYVMDTRRFISEIKKVLSSKL